MTRRAIRFPRPLRPAAAGRALAAALAALLLVAAFAPQAAARGAWRAALLEAGLLCGGARHDRDPAGAPHDACALCAACAQPASAPPAAKPPVPTAPHLSEHRHPGQARSRAESPAPAPLARAPPGSRPSA